ncbi:rhomboid family intramembrane serine protease [Croceitalea dokdonensis]|nr:rhomboid family intramembrane serine protease [Croceitalea dokdonensis]
MNENSYYKFTTSMLLVPLFAVLAIWTVFWIEVRFQVNLNYLGVYPRTIKGLAGIGLSPLIHGSLEHLYNNTIPLAILSLAVVYFYKDAALRVFLLGVVCSGALTWVIGRPSYHIGASGLIYALAAFIFFKGVFSKYYRLIALSLGVVFIYGSMLWYIFPIEDGISWEGHLSGFLVGLVLAKVIPTRLPSPQRYQWEKEDFNEDDDPFLKHFDADGNFMETGQEQDPDDKTEIIYHYKKNPKTKD